MDDKLKKFIKRLNSHITGVITEDELKSFLPIKDEKIEIVFNNKRIIFGDDKKSSTLQEKNDEFENIEILKRIGYMYNITLSENTLFKRTKFSLQMKKLVGDN